MKSMKSASLILLAAALAAPCLSCGESAENSQTTAPVVPGETTVETDETESLFVKDKLPDNLDFEGKTIGIYVRGDTLNTEFESEDDGDIVNTALYQRNMAVEERLNVTLNFICNTSADYWGDRNTFMDTVRGSVMANDGSIDLAAGLSNIMPYLAQEGMFRNYLSPEAKNIDFTAPWWSSSILDQLVVNGKLYLVSGDACLGVTMGMMCMYFNKQMLEEYDLEDPYTLVQSGKWTLDKLDELSSSVYADLNGNNTVDEQDRFGFLVPSENHAPNFVTSFGRYLVEFDQNQKPVIAVENEWFADFFDRMHAIMENESSTYQPDTNKPDYTNAFREGRILFETGEFNFAERFRDMTFDFGLIPYPKYDESQDGYYTSSRSTLSLFGVTATADLSFVSTVLEAFASESYRSVTPIYFEKALKVKYSRDSVTAQMFDLIHDGVLYDFGIIHGVLLNGLTTQLRKTVLISSQNWASTYAKIKNGVESTLNDYLTAIDALED